MWNIGFSRPAVDLEGELPGRIAAMRGEHDRVRRLALLAYVVIGVIVASRHDYYTDLAIVSRVVSAVVATALWPLILLGASLHLNLGQL
jgi:energy-converting hydrogenase Eha subunit C